MKVPLYILEGAWDTAHEVPQVLPYFAAYAQSHREIHLYHRTFRCIEDVQFYVSRLTKGGKAFLYFACHGEDGYLVPSDGRSKIPLKDVEEALKDAKEESLAFLHFSCCTVVRSSNRRQTLTRVMKSARAQWVSGYTREVDWLSSTLLDLAIVANIYVPWRTSAPVKEQKDARKEFVAGYEQLARSLGLSSLSALDGEEVLFPRRLRTYP